MRSGTVLCSLCGVVLIVPFHGSLEILRGAESTEQFWSSLSKFVRTVRSVRSTDPAGKGQASSQSSELGLKHCCVLVSLVWQQWAILGQVGKELRLTSNPAFCFQRAAACFPQRRGSTWARTPLSSVFLWNQLLISSRVQGTSLLVLPTHQRRLKCRSASVIYKGKQLHVKRESFTLNWWGNQETTTMLRLTKQSFKGDSWLSMWKPGRDRLNSKEEVLF